MKKIHIIQPVLPHYRINFYEKLISQCNREIYFYTTKKDFNGVISDEAFLSSYKNVEISRYRYFKYFYWQGGVLKVFRKVRSGDCVVLSGNPRVIDVMITYFFLLFKRVKVVWWGQGWSAGRRGLSSRFRLQLMKLASKILVYTEVEKEKLCSDYKFKSDQIISINNGLSSKYNQDSSKLEKDYDFVFVGRLTRKSNFSLLIDALLSSEKKFSVAVIGKISDDEKAKINSLNIKSKIVFFGEIFDSAEVGQIVSKSRFFVYPGAVGLSLFTAFSKAVPAIIHDNVVNHMPEGSLHRPNETGFVFNEGDYISLLKVMNESLDIDVSTYREMCSCAYEIVAKNYNTAEMVKRFIRAILE